MATQRVKEIDLLRGMAIILVLLGHAIIVYPIDLHEILWCEILFTWLSTVHMPLFFLISGFCYSLGNNGYCGFFLKKTKRLLIPYLFFSIFDMIMRVIFGSFVNQQRGFLHSVKNMFFFGGGYWFLYVLYIIFLIFPLLERIIKKQPQKVWLLLGVLAFFEIFGVLPRIFMLDSVGKYLIYFLIGYLINLWRPKITEISSYAKHLEPILSVLIVLMWMILVGVIVAYGSHPIMNLITAVFGMLSLWMLTKKISHRRNYLLTEFSRYSLPLYLMNGYLLVVSRTIFVSKMGVTNPMLIIVVNMLITLFVAWIFIKLVIDRAKPLKFIFGML